MSIYRSIISNLEYDRDQFEVHKGEFAASFATNPLYAFEWKAEGIALAQAKWEIADRILEELEDHSEEEVFDEFVKKFEREAGMIRAGSKSTSQWANLVEDTKFQAKAHLFSQIAESRRYAPKEES